MKKFPNLSTIKVKCRIFYKIYTQTTLDVLYSVWKNIMALASARLDCPVSSSGADYKAWSGAGQNCNVYVQSAASHRLASHKSATIQPLIRGWLAINWWSVNKVVVEKPF